MKNITLKNLDITIDSGELISIIGPNGCGKTVLLKMICGKIKNSNLLINNRDINLLDIDYKRKNIVCVFDDNIYNTRFFKEELEYYLNILKFSDEEINNRIDIFVEYFKLESLISCGFDLMSIENRIYCKILSLLIIYPTILCIDDLFSYLNKDKRIKIFNYIKEHNITLLCVTSQMEELLIFDKILVMNKGEKVIFDKTEIVLNNENIFKELGLSLPFIYDINNMLMSYDLIGEPHYNNKELVDLLWK